MYTEVTGMRVTRKLISTLIVVVTILHGCADKGAGLEFAADRNTIRKNGISLTSSLTADPKSGILILKAIIKNDSKQVVTAAAFRAQLRSDSGYINIPVNTKVKNFTVSPSENRSFTLEYKPVNNPQLFQRIRFKGDLSRKYTFNPAFITDMNGRVVFSKKIRFTLKKAKYSIYKKKYGKSPKLFSLRMDKKAFRKKHLKYYSRLPKKKRHDGNHTIPASMIISGEELMVRQMIFKMVPYLTGKRLFIFLKIINRSNGLSIHLNGLQVSAGGKVYKPVNGFSPGLSTDKKKSGKVKIKLQRNGRLYFHIDYGIVDTFRKLSVSLPGLLDENKKPLFILPLEYTSGS